MAVYPYWIEKVGNDYNIWIKVNIPAKSTTRLYVVKKVGYYPNGNAVFDFFDDFRDSSTTKFTHLRGDGDYGFENSMLYITGASDGFTAFQSPLLNLPNKFVIHVKVYAYDWNEWVGFGISIEDNLGTEHDLGLLKNGYSFGWWGWGGNKHSMRTVKNSSVIVDDYGVYDGFYHATNGHYYLIGAKYDGNTLYHFKPIDLTNSSTYTIEYDHTRSDTTFSNQNWKRIVIEVWNGAKWGYDYIFVRKCANQDPSVLVEHVSSNVWKVTIYNPNDYDLTEFQVAITGIPIDSENESLYISDTLAEPLEIGSMSLAPTTVSLNKKPLQVTFTKRMKLYLTQDVGSTPTDVILHIPPEVGENFWNHRGRNLVLTDKDGNMLNFVITSESTNELYGIVQNLSNYTINDVFYLYFDDGLDRDTSNLVTKANPPDVDTSIYLAPRLISESGSIVKFPFLFFGDFNSENICIFNDTKLLEHVTETTSSCGRIYVKFPYMLTKPKVTLYIYPTDLPDDDMGPLDAIIYDGKIESMKIEQIDVAYYGARLIINGKEYNVIQKWVEDTPKIGVYTIEEAPDSVVNYGQYSRLYKAVLHIPTLDELNELEKDLQKETVSVIWDNESFTAVPLQYSNQMVLNGVKKYWIVELTLRRIFDKKIQVF